MLSYEEFLKQTIEKMRELTKREDWESAHVEADELLCKFLDFLGHEPHKELIELYWNVGRWYA